MNYGLAGLLFFFLYYFKDVISLSSQSAKLCDFFLAGFKSFSSYLIFFRLTDVPWCGYLCISPTWGSLSFWIWKFMSFQNLGNFWSLFLQMYFCLIPVFSFWDTNLVIYLLLLARQWLRICPLTSCFIFLFLRKHFSQTRFNSQLARF